MFLTFLYKENIFLTAGFGINFQKEEQLEQSVQSLKVLRVIFLEDVLTEIQYNIYNYVFRGV